jgi:hypothetical protein
MENNNKTKMIPLSWILVGVAGFLLVGTGILWMSGRTIKGYGRYPLDYYSRKLRSDSVRTSHLPSAVITEAEKKAFDAFQRWADSVKKNSAGRRVFDSLMRARPGLMDSAGKVRKYLGLRDLLPGP